MPSGEAQNYSYIQQRPLRITPLRACAMKDRTSPSEKKTAARQRAQKRWLRYRMADNLQQLLMGCDKCHPADRNSAATTLGWREKMRIAGEHVSRTHGLGENSPAVSSCGEKPSCGQWRAAEFLMRGAGGDLISPAGVENIRGGRHRCCLCSKTPERQCADLPRR